MLLIILACSADNCMASYLEGFKLGKDDVDFITIKLLFRLVEACELVLKRKGGKQIKIG